MCMLFFTFFSLLDTSLCYFPQLICYILLVILIIFGIWEIDFIMQSVILNTHTAGMFLHVDRVFCVPARENNSNGSNLYFYWQVRVDEIQAVHVTMKFRGSATIIFFCPKPYRLKMCNYRCSSLLYIAVKFVFSFSWV
jgi:hypothetical protein